MTQLLRVIAYGTASDGSSVFVSDWPRRIREITVWRKANFVPIKCAKEAVTFYFKRARKERFHVNKVSGKSRRFFLNFDLFD